jgi:type I restriction enzyme M protein
MPGNDEFNTTWQVPDQLGAMLSPSQSRAVVLSLVFARAQHEDLWMTLRSQSHPDLAVLLRGLPGDVPSEGSVPAASVRAMMDATDRLFLRAGGDGAFRFLLELFATHEGKGGADVYTPASLTAILAGLANLVPEMTVYDPFCRSGELLTGLAARARDEEPRTVLKLYGVSPNAESLAFAEMNATLHRRDHDFKLLRAEELLSSPPTGDRFEFILANPPFNMVTQTSREPREWPFGPPPLKNANFAWLQHIVERLAPDGRAAVIMPNGALFTANLHERHIRAEMVEAGCVEALISLPTGLFRHTGIAVTVWMLAPPTPGRTEILFIDASSPGSIRHDLPAGQVERITGAVREWRRGGIPQEVDAIAVSLAGVRERDYNLSPAIFLAQSSSAGADGDAISNIRAIAGRLEDQHRQAAESDALVAQMLKRLTS